MFQIGQKVLWHFETTSGWGADFWVPATVEKIRPKRIQIAAELRNGGTKTRWVRPDKLKASEG